MLLSLKQLLASIVDYAGLFPPAQLSLLEAAAIYDRAQSASDQWFVDRFVLPASRLPEWVALLPSWPRSEESGQPWSLSVILSQNWMAELEQIRQLQAVTDQFLISVVEVIPLSQDATQQVCLALPAGVTPFFEIPWDADLAPYLKILQQAGAAAKLRTGGVVSSAFPDSAQLGGRILALANAQIPFKATAGLHHPLRGKQRLTYQPDSASTTMHGFLNLAILAVLAYQQSITCDEAVSLLEEQSIGSFQFTQTEIRWHDHVLPLSTIEQARQHFFRSFGSCSIQEPIADLHTLRLL